MKKNFLQFAISITFFLILILILPGNKVSAQAPNCPCANGIYVNCHSIDAQTQEQTDCWGGYIDQCCPDNLDFKTFCSARGTCSQEIASGKEVEGDAITTQEMFCYVYNNPTDTEPVNACWQKMISACELTNAQTAGDSYCNTKGTCATEITAGKTVKAEIVPQEPFCPDIGDPSPDPTEEVTPEATATVGAGETGPSPTPNPCFCQTSTGKCTTACTFAPPLPIPSLTYANPIKCQLANTMFLPTPALSDKNGWCNYTNRTQGDANGDGQVNFLDYFYFVRRKAGGKVPPSVNLDFNGNASIGDWDRKIIVYMLKKLLPISL